MPTTICTCPDIWTCAVMKFAANGTLLAEFSTTNPAFGFLNGIALDGSSNIYVADTYNFRVVKLDSIGTQIAIFNTSNFPPLGITLDAGNNIYLTSMADVLPNN